MEDSWGNPIQHLIYCTLCSQNVTAIQQGGVRTNSEDGGVEVVLVRCLSCSSALLLRRETWNPVDDEWTEWRRVWPSSAKQLDPSIPSALREEQEEARKCFEARAYTATAVMVRRTLEGVCAEHGISKKPLAQAIREMQANGLLDERLVEWVNQLRVVGNEGAHYTGKQLSREDAEDALAFSEALLDYVYALAAKFDAFKARREAAATPTSGV